MVQLLALLLPRLAAEPWACKEENLRLRDHEPEKLAFYSKATTDFEFLFPFGWGELWGVADRTDYDLTQHQNHSGKSMEYLDPGHQREIYPLLHRAFSGRGRVPCWPSCATPMRSRSWRAATCVPCCTCIPALAPFKAAVLPLQKNKLGALASEHLREAVQAASWWTTTRPAPSASATAVRTRSARRSASRVDFDTEEDRHRYRPRPRHHAAGAREGGRSGSLHCPAGEILNRVPFFGRGQVSDWLSPPIFENRTNGFRRENAAGLSNLRGTAL